MSKALRSYSFITPAFAITKAAPLKYVYRDSHAVLITENGAVTLCDICGKGISGEVDDFGAVTPDPDHICEMTVPEDVD